MKIILKKTGEVIPMGTIIHLALTSPLGVVKQDVEICEENLSKLIQMGIIWTLTDEELNRFAPAGSAKEKALIKLDKRNSVKHVGSIEQFTKAITPERKIIADVNMDPHFYLDTFEETPAKDALVQGGMEFLVLIHIAVILDQRYARNISESKELYWCNPTNGKVEQLDKKALKVKSFNKFPAFRTREDAIAALMILSRIRKQIKENDMKENAKQ